MLMQSRPRPRLHQWLAILFCVALTTSSAAVQRTPARGPRDVQDLAVAWTALAAGRASDAEKLSETMLQATPRSHEAVGLQIRARAGRSIPGALDAYEAWLQKVRQREDAGLLETIALAAVTSHSTSSDAAVRARALEILAATGDPAAIDQLRSAAASAGADMAADIALVRLGDSTATQRLADRIKDGGRRDVSDAIDTLRDRGVKSAAGIIARALDPARPLPTKMAAARALGQLGDATSVPPLKTALNDADPPVRIMAAAALTRLGDNSGAEIMRSIENSPVADFRLLAIEASAPGNPTGPWVGVATAALKDFDPFSRLRAAELLLQYAADPAPARDLLLGSLADPNPAMRNIAAQSLSRVPPTAVEGDLPALRRLLRQAAPMLQLEAANAILRISGAIS